MSTTINAPALLNSQGAQKLMDDLKASVGSDLQLDASDVKHVGAQALQVMLAAQTHWGASSEAFEIVNPSPDFRQGIVALGAESLITNGEQTT